MAIVGQHPDHGVRIVLERQVQGGPPWRYVGDAKIEDASFGVTALLGEDGAVTVDLFGDAPGDLAERVRLIVRSAWKHTRSEGLDPPRRISRWRGDR